MADSEKRAIMIAMDGSSYADYAFECKYRFDMRDFYSKPDAIYRSLSEKQYKRRIKYSLQKISVDFTVK